MIAWVCKLLTPTLCLFWAAFFKPVTISHVVVIRVVGDECRVPGGPNKGALSGGRRMNRVQRPTYGLCGSSLHSNHFKLNDISTSKLSVKSQFITHKPNKVIALWLSQGQEKATAKSRPVILQGNKEGRIKVYWTRSPFLVKSVRLILSVWKPDYVESSHIYG